MRKTYTAGGMTFQMRTFTGRDLARVTGKLGILPSSEMTAGSPVTLAWRSNDIADQLLALCSRVPKLTLDEPNEIPEGTIPVSELPDATYLELVKQLCADSGFSAEAAEEVRPTSETNTVS